MGSFVATFFLFYLAFSYGKAKYQMVQKVKLKAKYQYEYLQMVQHWPQSTCSGVDKSAVDKGCKGKPTVMSTLHRL